MSNAQAEPRNHLIDSRGWDSAVEAQLLRRSDMWDAPEFRSHWHTLRRLFNDKDLAIDAVVCIEDRPTVCIVNGKNLQATQIEEKRKKLWNFGATTLLVVDRPHDVQVFSTLVKPSRNDAQGLGARLNSETIENLESAEFALRVRQFVRRVETGAIYREVENKHLFDPKNAVDQSLLENLKTLRNLISPNKSVASYRRAHALIGKFLFSCYLIDRGIVGSAYLNQNDLPIASNMLNLMDSIRGSRLIEYSYTLESLFQALQRDFNGSLFTNQPDNSVTDTEVDYLRRFLTGENLRSGQLSLFNLYDFSFIPVELISSIYQEFLGAEAEAEAPPTRKNQLRNHGQRAQGAYYTPSRLAELTVDIATQGWDTLLDKRCLDPACGSGIFLVILFVRMAEEWRKLNPDATTEHRYHSLLQLFSKNLRGVDIHHTACLITCFSLYLAFLDQMEPKEIIELQVVLSQNIQSKKLLPRIFQEGDEARPRSPHSDCIRKLDFFEMEAEPQFDLVVGNPPWVSRKAAPSAEAWLYDAKRNSAAKGLTKTEQKQTLFPNKELSIAFMWKAGLHLYKQGRVCQVLPSRVFLSNNTDYFQASWLGTHRLESVWLLADYRFVLFPGADCPCFIGRYHTRGDGEDLGEFEFITPKVELLDPREALIPVQPEDQKMLDQANLIAAAKRAETASAWKQYHWGTPRDKRLIDRLMDSPKLSSIAKSPPKDASEVLSNQTRQWFKGQGFQPATDSTTEPKEVFWESTDLFISAEASSDNLVLLETDCEPISDRYPNGLHRDRSPLIYQSPLLLINKACTKFLFSDFNVLFQDDFQSICAPKVDEDELLFLTAVLSSPLAQYLLFHTTANIGIERDIARLEELLQLPFPLPEYTSDRERSQNIVRDCASLLRGLKHELRQPENLLSRHRLIQGVREQLTTRIYDYFDICEWERYLIEDTVKLFRPSSTPASIDAEKLYTAQPSSRTDRKTYADTLSSTFRGWSRTRAEIWTESCVASKFGLTLLTLGVGGRSTPYKESRAEEYVEDLLRRIRESIALDAGTVFQCLRGFTFYEGAKVHLLKPLSRRHWTRTAALNDADAILVHMMQEEGWGE